MDNNNESKAERFIRVAEPRVGRACKAISLIGNFATGDYEYTEQQVDAMFAAMQEELDAQRAKFKKGSERKFRFDGGTR